VNSIDNLVVRAAAIDRFVAAGNGVVPDARLDPARELITRTGQRLALSREHTVVALAGATGSGKSSLFNALSRMRLSPVGVLRPTTDEVSACVWSGAGAEPLLDWLGITYARRFERESLLDGDDEAPLRGLVLLDLPDLDSVAAGHQAEADRVLALVDLVVWVTDPQKYADRALHERYLRRFGRHRDVTVVVLNQADRLSPADAEHCVSDLAKLLAADGLSGVPVFAVSAVSDRPGLAELRGALEKAVAAKQSALRRLTGDLEEIVAGLDDLTGPPGYRLAGATAADALASSLSAAAGVPALADAAGRAYRHQAAKSMRWPVSKLWPHHRPDILARLHLAGPGALPVQAQSQRAAVALAVRTLSSRAGHELPEPWADAVIRAAGTRLTDLPDLVDAGIGQVDLKITGVRQWWQLVHGAQWLVTGVTVVGALWAALDLVAGSRNAGPPVTMFAGGILAGIALWLLTAPAVELGAGRARRAAQRRLQQVVADVGREYVLRPAQIVMHRYELARTALAEARR
jgi:GTP-binding protein EngB required for normal cell division